MKLRFLGLALLVATASAALAAGAEETPAHTAASAAKIVVAVADFTAKDVDIADAVTETFVNDLARSKKLQLVERSRLKKVLEEHKIAMSGLTDPAKAAEFGKFLQARHMILGSMTAIGDKVALHGRLVDVEQGTIVEGAALTREGDKNDLYGLAHQLATCLHHAITGEFLPEADTAAAPAGASSPPAASGSDVLPGDPFAGLAPSSELKLDVRLDRPRGAVYYQGDTLKVFFRVDRPAYVYLFNVDTSRYVSQIYPNQFRREERVLLLMQDTTDWPVCFLGAMYAGIVPVAVNTLLTAED
ncbi:MAG: CsgG/HfaB family protein, partial [Armatimonadota bacterium]|nr:CsgG/HfaB family protein [Armatimonadota bacterium]